VLPMCIILYMFGFIIVAVLIGVGNDGKLLEEERMTAEETVFCCAFWPLFAIMALYVKITERI